jgi:Endonuclease-reverse transcriptase
MHNKYPDHTRSVILINTNILSDAWKQIQFDHPDITAIEIQGNFGTLRIINVYNDCNNNSSLTHLSMYMRDREKQRCTAHPLSTMWVGDFNRHHPIWDEPRNAHLFTQENLELAQPLLNMLGHHNMKMALPALIPTLKSHSTGNLTRVDNVFCTEDLADAVIKCDTDEAARPIKTDHYPIITQLNIYAPKQAWEPRRNFRTADWPKLVKTLKENLANISPPTEINSIEEFDIKLKDINDAVQNAVGKHVKLTKPSPYAKRWWTKELTDAKKKTGQLGRRSRRQRLNEHHPIHEEYRQQCNRYADMIRKTKAEHGVDWLEGLDESSIWQVSRIMTSPASDASKSRIPTLVAKDPITKRITREAIDNESKGKWFHELFFPPTDPTTTPIPQNHRYPPAKWTFTNVTEEQVHQAIKKMQPHKATKSGTIPNSVLIHTREDLVPFLTPLFRATNTLKYYPQDWATTEMLVMKKPGKPDYMNPAAWQPIVLSDGLARLLNRCQTEDIVNMCEQLNIIPANHFSARPGRTTTDAIHLLTKMVKDAW